MAGSNAGKWSATRKTIGGSERIRLFEDGRDMHFGRYLSLLQDDQEFARWYTRQLTNSPFPAFFWEHPPLTLARHTGQPVELVLVDAPMMQSLRQDATPFRAYFSDEPMVLFPSLGGDATLLAPSPIDAATDYAHLAAFLRTADERQIQALWCKVGIHVAASLRDEPIWLSTSGLGVAWLHVRLDSMPKYYQHQPYKHLPAADRAGYH